MKKMFNICVLLLSLVGCSNNVVSTSSYCPCENLTTDNTKYTIESINLFKKDEVKAIYLWSEKGGIRDEIKIKYLDIFYSFLNIEYSMTNMNYIDNYFDYEENKDKIWAIVTKESPLEFIEIYQIFNENGDSYIILFDTDPYISDLITKEENDSFINSVDFRRGV